MDNLLVKKVVNIYDWINIPFGFTEVDPENNTNK